MSAKTQNRAATLPRAEALNESDLDKIRGGSRLFSYQLDLLCGSEFQPNQTTLNLSDTGTTDAAWQSV